MLRADQRAKTGMPASAATTLPMQQEVVALSLRDMIDAAAYAASLKP